MRKIFLYISLLMLGLLLILALVLRLRFGGGSPYPDLSTSPAFSESTLEEVLSFPEPLGNIAVSADGRIFFTVHPESRPTGPTVLEITNGQTAPYPSETKQSLFKTVLGLCIDEQNRLWTIDHGNHGLDPVRLLAFDLSTNEIVHDYAFTPSIAPIGSFFNDFSISPDGQWIYIADVNFFGKKPALIVYDIENKRARRLLENHTSIASQDYIIETPLKKMTFLGGLIALKPGIDGIVVNTKGDYLYYGAMTHDGLYRIATSDLQDEGLRPTELADRIERVGTKPLSDGLSIDTLDQVYITDVEHGGIARMEPDGTLKTLIKAPERVRWADGCSFGPDGYLYFTDSAIPDQMLRSKSHMKAAAPYFIYRFKPDHAGTPGR
ncbi:MAG: L-dopachrome tautomerase-related protein [Bacteroidota bacterium]